MFRGASGGMVSFMHSTNKIISIIEALGQLIAPWSNRMTTFFLNRRYPLILFLLVSFCVISPRRGQCKNVQGSIINSISLSSQQGNPVLIIGGKLKPDQLSGVTISDPENNIFTITVPNALLDPQNLPMPTITFPPNNYLIQINAQESVRESETGQAIYLVKLTVKTKKTLIPSLSDSFNSLSMSVILKDPEVIAQNQLMARERQQAIKRKREMERAKKRIKSAAKRSVQSILRHYHKPSIMQISILNASGYERRAFKLSVFLGKLKREYIEESLGIKMDIVNISNARSVDYPQSTIYFRENYLKSALTLAKLIKGEQKIVPMNRQKEKRGVDIEIYLGRDYK